MITQRIGKIKLRRGTVTQLVEIILEEGELVFLVDKERYMIGDGSTYGGISVTNRSYIVNSYGIPSTAMYGDIIYNTNNKTTFIVGYDPSGKILELFEICSYGKLLWLQERLADIFNKIRPLAGFLIQNEPKTPPYITRQPISQVIDRTLNATFSLTAEGSPALSYQWYKNNIPVLSTNNASYTINNIQYSDAGSFYCKVTNPYGYTESNVVTLQVTSGISPLIITHPLSQTLNNGSNATFSVSANGGGYALSFQWYKNNIIINGETNSNLTLINVTSADETNYKCIVSNRFSSVNSNQAYLKVNVGTIPIVTTHPISVNKNNGLTATFNVVANGNAPITYQWYKNGISIIGSTSDILILPNVASSDVAAYKCKVENSFGSIFSNSANLTVNIGTGPVITIQPKSQIINNGLNYTFNVVVTGTPTLTYQWYKDNIVITGATNSTYSIVNATAINDGTYKCIITNSFGDATSDNATLTVNIGTVPIITTQPVSLNRNNGLIASFNVIANGSAPLTYQWYKNDIPITGAIKNAYVIASVTSSDAGNYKCIVSNGFGSVVSTIVSLTVNSGGVPVITTQPISRTLNNGLAATFTVIATGTAPLSYQWYKNGTNLITGATSSTYTVTNVSSTDEGTYKCVVSNSFGTVTSTDAVLKVNMGFAPSITTQPVAKSSLISIGTVRFSNPSGITIDSSNNLYVCDTYNHTIRKITPAGVVTTFAGTAGQSGSIDGTGSVARFYAPFGITIDSSGNLYVCDYSNHTIRKITPAGMVTTIAGTAGASGITDGTGSAARFNHPIGITIDPSGNLYVCDFFNHTIRKITPSGVVTTIAGTAGYAGLTDTADTISSANFTFNVVATGTPSLSYQWYKNNTLISGATSSTYTITNAVKTDEGGYKCIVTNTFGSVESNVAVLTLSIGEKPAISIQPIGQTYIEGGSPVTYSVTATGTAPLTYQWFDNGAAILGATNNTFVINSRPQTNHRDYSKLKCKVTNIYGDVFSNEVDHKNICKLLLNATHLERGGIIVIDSSGKTVYRSIVTINELYYTLTIRDIKSYDVDILFEQTTGGGCSNPDKTEIYKNNRLIKNINSSMDRAELSISDTVWQNLTGEYCAVYTNLANSVTSTKLIINPLVLTPLTIVTQPKDETIKQFESSTISVSAIGTGPLTYQWQEDGIDVVGQNKSGYVYQNYNKFLFQSTSIVVDDFYNIYLAKKVETGEFISTEIYLITPTQIKLFLDGFTDVISMCIDKDSNLYINDSGNIKKITKNKQITNITNIVAANGLCIDSNKNLYVTSNNKIIKITQNGDKTDFCTVENFPWNSSKYAITIDSNNNLYTLGAGFVFKITQNGIATKLYDNFSSSFLALGIITDKNSNIYIANNSSSSTITKITQDGKSSIIDNTNFVFPAALGIDSEGSLYVTDINRHNIKKMTPNLLGTQYTVTEVPFLYKQNLKCKVSNDSGSVLSNSVILTLAK